MSLINLTWVDPATLVGGAPIPPNDFADVEVSVSIDNGKTYVPAGHAAPGAQSFQFEATDPGTYNFKLNSKDTQIPPLLGPDSVIVSVVVPAPPLAAIAAPTNVAASLA